MIFVSQLMLSEKIELVISILEQCKSDSRWYETQLKDEERKENNIRHEMEGVATTSGKPPLYNERARLATQWQNMLITRRVAKDNIDTYKPMVDFIDSDIGKKALNVLRQKLGDIRKIEREKKERVYFKRKTDETPNNPVMSKSLNKMIRDWKRCSNTQ